MFLESSTAHCSGERDFLGKGMERMDWKRGLKDFLYPLKIGKYVGWRGFGSVPHSRFDTRGAVTSH